MPRPPAPEIDHPYVFSVSQVETFVLCPRKWAFEKIDRIERPQNKFAKLGEEVHEVLEDYLTNGTEVNPKSRLGRIAAPGLIHLPRPGTPGLRIEKWFVILFGVAAYRGLKDLEWLVRPQHKYPLVLDHKSTRNVAWAKTKADLLKDTQAGVYAADAMLKTNKDYCDLQWQYYKTEGKPDSFPIENRISRNQAGDVLTRTNAHAENMIRTLKMFKPGEAIQVTPNFKACSAFGGCPYRKEHCKPKPHQVLKAIMAQKTAEAKSGKGSTSSFLADIKNRNDNEKSKDKDKKGTKDKAPPEKEPKKVKVSDAKSVPVKDPVNPPDRAEFEPPPPPPAKRFNGKWVQPEWDEAAAKWVFPDEVTKAEKTKDKAEEKKKKKGGLLSQLKDSPPDDEEDEKEDDEEAEQEEEQEEEAQDTEADPDEEEEEDTSENQADADRDQALNSALQILTALVIEKLEQKYVLKLRK